MSYIGILVVKRIMFVMLLLKGSLCLRDVYLEIPEAVERGKPAVIKCMYNLENEELYQVKWYHGDREFCRYSPRDVPPIKEFPIDGLKVDLEKTDARQLTIKAATHLMQGRYTCEVSADAPSFMTAQMHGEIYVVDIPKSGPEIYGLKPLYKAGMKLKAECITRNSFPPANMSFFINSEPAYSQHVWQKVSGGENGSLWTSFVYLQFVVQRHHFIRGKIRIRCSTWIYSVYFKSHEKVADEDKDRTTPAPLPMSTEARVFPIHQVSDNSNRGYHKSARTKLFIAGFAVVIQQFHKVVLR